LQIMMSPTFGVGMTLLFSSLLSAISAGKTITVFRNTLDPAEFGTKGGAILNNNASKTSKTETDAAAICFRFNLKVLAGLSQGGRGTLLQIGNWYVWANQTDLMKVHSSSLARILYSY
jgi:hypothetical protein